MFKRSSIVMFGLLSGLPVSAFASCGTAFCSINTDWAVQDVWTEPGWRLDARLEYIDQDQPRHGSDRVSVGELPRHHDEISTRNLNFIGTVDYTFNERWALSVRVPVVDRDHEHLHHHHGAQLRETWDFTRLGDIMVLGRYQFAGHPLQGTATGLRVGLKLPTGSFTVSNSEGAEAERSLQPGTGTTDLVLGLYHQATLPGGRGSWFTQALWQYPLEERKEYRPGNQFTLDLGASYPLVGALSGMAQLNVHYKGTDRGRNAEPEDSGSRTVSVSPGLAYSLGQAGTLYGFVQAPLYQHVEGVQLTADWSAVLGWTRRF